MQDDTKFTWLGHDLTIQRHRKFTGDVPLDGNYFVNCDFDDCRFIIAGEAAFSFTGCRLGEFTVLPVGNALMVLASLGKLLDTTEIVALIERLALLTDLPTRLN